MKLIVHILVNFPIMYNEVDIWDFMFLRWRHITQTKVHEENCNSKKNKFASSLQNKIQYHLKKEWI
jgi:hypothetical protein